MSSVQINGPRDGHTRSATVSPGSLVFTAGAAPIDDDGAEVVALVSFVDITDRYRETSQLAWEAVHDPLTGLYNRSGIIREL